MQLQAERSFVHSGIGGGSSSSSSSSSSAASSPKQQPQSPPSPQLLNLKVANLKKPSSKKQARNTSSAPVLSTNVAAVEQLTEQQQRISLLLSLSPGQEVSFGAVEDDAMSMDIDPPSQHLQQQRTLAPLHNNNHSSHLALSSVPMDLSMSSSMSMVLMEHDIQEKGQKEMHEVQEHTQAHIPYPPPPPPLLSCSPSSPQSVPEVTLSSWTTGAPPPPPPPPPPLPSALASASACIPSLTTLHRNSNNRVKSTLIPDLSGSFASDPASCTHVLTLTGPSPPTTADRLAQLPSEMLFDILCRLNALDLSRVAQINKFYSKAARDNALWRVKSVQHPLFSEQHLLNRKTVHWLSYFQFLHRNSCVMKQNWANACPQAVHVLEGHTGLVSSIEMSTWSLVTASIDSTLRVWDLRTLQCIQVLRSKQSLTCVSQSEIAGAACARTSFGALCIWDIKSGELILQDDTAMPQIASFIYMDERFIGYGQCDGVVTVFDWSSRASLKVVGTYQAHEGDVIHISVLDKKFVISASTNGETLVYSLAQSRIVERILLPHATQAIQFSPTIHGDKVMFSTRDAVYEYELLLDRLSSRFPTDPIPTSTRPSTTAEKQAAMSGTIQDSQDQCMSLSGGPGPSRSSHTRSQVALSAPVRQTATASRAWKTSNSLLSQIRQRIGTGRREPNEDMDPSLPTDLDQHKQLNQQQQLRPITIPTRFPRLASVYCLPRTSRHLDHGTTSARDSYGVFMPHSCTRLDEISVYTRITKQIRQIRGPAVEEVLRSAVRNPFYTTMECNQHCAVVSSGNKVYVISFLPLDV